MNDRVGFIGAGNMAGAIINGILSNTNLDNLVAYDIDKSKCERFGCRVAYVDSMITLAESCEYLFFAIKPQIIDQVLDQLANANIDWSNKTVISMVAGISTDYIANRLHADLSIVRIMPNTPFMLGCGTTGICANANTSAQRLQYAKALLTGASLVCDISEEHMNASINLNGSSPAYLFLFAKAAIDYAKSEGIDEETATKMFANTMIGSAKMLVDSGMDPQSLINMVTSPGGTTLAALNVFHEKGFTDTISAAMSACTKRAFELGK